MNQGVATTTGPAGARDPGARTASAGGRVVSTRERRSSVDGDGIDLPMEVYLRRGEILGSSCGITRRMLENAIAAGALKAHFFPGFRYAKYDREEVVKVFALGLHEHER